MAYKMICQHCECVFEAPVARKYCDDCVPRSHIGRTSKYQRVVGEKYGKLTTLAFEQRTEKDQKRWYVLCRCDCGVEKWIHWINVASGRQFSCGCARLEAAKDGVKLFWEARRAAIVEYAIQNPLLSYREIGTHFGLTRERVRQVLLKELGADAVEKRKKERSTINKDMLDELERLRALVGDNRK